MPRPSPAALGALVLVAANLPMLLGRESWARALELRPQHPEELWRLLGGHLVHVDGEHFAWNLAGFVLLAVAAGRALPATWPWAWLATAPVLSLGLIAVEPDLAAYRGASGMLCALAGAALVGTLRRGHGLLALAALSLLAVKVAAEGLAGSGLFVTGLPAAGARVVPAAHLLGVLSGLGLGIVLTRSSTPRRASR